MFATCSETVEISQKTVTSTSLASPGGEASANDEAAVATEDSDDTKAPRGEQSTDAAAAGAAVGMVETEPGGLNETIATPGVEPMADSDNDASAAADATSAGMCCDDA